MDEMSIDLIRIRDELFSVVLLAWSACMVAVGAPKSLSLCEYHSDSAVRRCRRLICEKQQWHIVIIIYFGAC